MIEALAETWAFLVNNPGEFRSSVWAHLVLVGVALGTAIVVCVPLGLWSARSKVVSVAVINTILALRVVPSLAVLFLAIPYLGLGFEPAVLAITLLALPPVLVNTDAAFRGIDASVKEAAIGMGMTPGQVLRRVEIPLALPTVVAGIRTAATETIASATLAAFVGADSLGRFVVRGFAVNDTAILLAGALPVAGLALIAEVGLSVAQDRLQPMR